MSIYIGPVLNNTGNLIFQADFYKGASTIPNNTTFIKNISTFNNHGTGAGLTYYNNFVNFSSSSISIPQFTGITGSGSRTFISIVRPSGSGNMGLFDFGGSGVSGGFMGIFIDSGGFLGGGTYNSGGFSLSLSGTDYFVQYPTRSGSGFYDRNWHFIGVSYEQSNRNISICIDGTFPKRNDGTNQPFTNPFNILTDSNSSGYFSGIQYFGSIKTGYYNGFKNLTGDISHISIYNRSHTTGELIALYNTYKNRLVSGVF